MEEEKTSKLQKFEHVLVLTAIALIKLQKFEHVLVLTAIALIGVVIISLIVLAAVGLHYSAHS